MIEQPWGDDRLKMHGVYIGCVTKENADEIMTLQRRAGWMSVQERLPPETGPYACATTRYEHWKMLWFDAASGRWEGETSTLRVTHWFEVPELPTERGN